MAFARLNGIGLHWHEFGAAEQPAVILLHSLGTDLRLWGDVAPALAERWRVILPDLRGHGLSAVAAAGSIEDFAADSLVLADHLALGRFAVVGVSLGGLVAAALALAAPERVAALVLADTAGRIGSPESWAERIALVEAGGLAAIAGAVMQRWFSPAYAAARSEAVAGWRRLFLASPAAGYVDACRVLAATDLTPRLATLAAPTLCLVGAEDVSTPPALVAATAAALPKARFDVLAGCGHLPPAEQPNVLAAHIARHLTECGHV